MGVSVCKHNVWYRCGSGVYKCWEMKSDELQCAVENTSDYGVCACIAGCCAFSENVYGFSVPQ